MKAGKLIVNIIRKRVVKGNLKRVEGVVFDEKYKPRQDIPYIDDEEDYHKFDIYYAPKYHKNVLVIDIHGGSYMFGHRRENYQFGTIFLDAGYDYIAADYIPNDGKTRTTNDIIDDIVKCVSYIATHLKELNISPDVKIILTGDSAGGHIALTVAEIFSDRDYAQEIGYILPDINLKAVLINCPVFNYENLGKNILSKSGQKRMFGPHATDDYYRRKICPKTHIASLKVPLFASTCRNDFLRASEALCLKEVMSKRPNKFEFIDLDSKKKEVAHVHNVIAMDLEESKFVNKAMIEFIKKAVR